MSIRNIICICVNTEDISSDLSKRPLGRPTVLRVCEAADENKLLALQKCQSGKNLHNNQTKTNVAFSNVALSEMYNQSTLQYISNWTYFCLLSSLHMGQDLLLVLG